MRFNFWKRETRQEQGYSDALLLAILQAADGTGGKRLPA